MFIILGGDRVHQWSSCLVCYCKGHGFKPQYKGECVVRYSNLTPSVDFALDCLIYINLFLFLLVTTMSPF